MANEFKIKHGFISSGDGVVDGKLGIGTASPTEKLEVSGNIKSSSAIFLGLYSKLAWGDGNNYLKFSGGFLNIGYFSDAFKFDMNSSNTKSIEMVGDSNFQILGKSNKHILLTPQGTGNVGIGTTSPTHKLDVETADDIVASFVSTDNKASINIKDDNTSVFVSAENAKASFGFNVGVHANNLNVISSGNVGIGTTSPSLSGRGIHIENSGDAADIRLQRTDSGADLRILAGSSYAYVATNNAKALSFGANGSGNRHLTINTDGNVGIGTTSPAQKLTVSGNILQTSNSYFIATRKIIGRDNNGLDLMDDSGSNGISIKDGGNVNFTDYGSGNNTGTAAYALAIDASGTVIETTVQSSPAGIDGSGTVNYVTKWSTTDKLTSSVIYDDGTNVGIGTPSPTRPLSVYRSTAGSVANFLHYTDASNFSGLYIDVSNTDELVTLNASGDTAASFAFETGNAERMRISANGNVGIGTTSPSEKLEVDGIIKAVHTDNAYTKLRGTGLYFSRSNSYLIAETNNSLSLNIGDSTSRWANTRINSAYIKFENGSTENMRITSAGNVGIGTNNPAYKLDVDGIARVGASGASGQLYIKGLAGTGQYLYLDDGAVVWTMVGGTNYSIQSNGTSRLTATAGGDVGIGTTSPSQKLDVVGNILASGDLYSTAIRTVDNNPIKLIPGGTGNLYFGNAGKGMNVYHYSNVTLGEYASYTWNASGYSLSTPGSLSLNGASALYLKTAGSFRLAISSTGNVGIGTTAPANKLTVNQSTDSNGIRVYGHDDRSSSFLDIYVDAGGNSRINEINPGSSGYLAIVAQNYLSLSAASLVYTESNFRIYDTGMLSLGSSGDYKLKYDNVNDVLNIHTDDNKGISISSTGSLQLNAYGAGILKTDSSGNVSLDTSTYATQTYVTDAITDLVDSAPATLDTLNELAAALGDDANFSTTVTNSIATKLPFETYATGTDLDTISRTTFGAISTANTSPNRNQNYSAVYSLGVAGIPNTLQLGTASDYNASGLWVRQYNQNAASPQGTGWQNWAKVWTDNDFANNSTNWNTAYGWGNHASEGYLTSYTETDTLDSVTDRGYTTTNPIAVGTLTVGSSSASASYIYLLSSTTGESELRMGDTDTDAGSIAYNNPNNYMAFRANAAERLRITASGNVGIGTTNPATKLDVVGGVKSSVGFQANVNESADADNLFNNGIKYGFLLNTATNLPTAGNSNYSSLGNILLTHYDGASTNDFYIRAKSYNGLTSWNKVWTDQNLTNVSQLANDAGYITSAQAGIDQATADTRYVNVTGDTMTGDLTISKTTPILTFNSSDVLVDQGIVFSNQGNFDASIKHGASSADMIFDIGRNSTWGGAAIFKLDTYQSYQMFRDSHQWSVLGSEKMRVASNGNVGIGTTAPSSLLHVNGSFKATNQAVFESYIDVASTIFQRQNIRVLNKAGTNWVTWATRDTSGSESKIIFTNVGGNISQFTNDAGYITSAEAGIDQATADARYVNVTGDTMTGKLTINSNDFDTHLVLQRGADNLSISPSGGQLLVEGGLSPWGNVSENLGRSDKYWLQAYVYSIQSGGHLQFKSNGDNERMRITDVGNVGIGTTTPNQGLHVKDSGAIVSEFESSNNSISTIEVTNSSGNSSYFGTTGTSLTLGAGTYDSNDLVITTAGNVGIGTTIPNTNLHIAGPNQDASEATVRIGGVPSYGNSVSRLELAENLSGADMSYGFSLTADGASTNNLLIRNHSNNIAGNVAISVDRISGNVGIGTASPSNTLDVNGGAEINGETYIRSASNVGLRIQTTDQGIGGADGLRVGLNATHAFVWQYENKPLAFATNGGQRMTISAAGNVGIGTTSPAHKLQVEGDGRVTDRLIVGSTSEDYGTLTVYSANAERPLGIRRNGGAGDFIRFNVDSLIQGVISSNGGGLSFNGGSTQNYTQLFLNNDGTNVGIGTTNPAAKLEVAGSTITSDLLITPVPNQTFTRGVGDTHSQIYINPVRGNRSLSIVTEQIAQGEDIDGTVLDIFYTNTGAGNDLLFRNGGTNTMVLKANNKVGIGTLNPGYDLQVIGDASISTWLYVNNIYPTSSTNDILINTGAGRTITINPTSTGKTVIPNGNVGIGTTSPTAALHVQKAINGGFAGTIYNTQATGGFGLSVRGGNSSAEDALRVQNVGGTYLLNVKGNGNVGIGTTSPSDLLTVDGDARITGTLKVADGAYNSPSIAHRADEDTGIYFPANDTIAISTSAAERMRITSAGNVGIGTTSPQTNLDVFSGTGGTLRLGTSDTVVLGGDTIGRIEFFSSDATNTNSGLGAFIDLVADGDQGNFNPNGDLRFGTSYASASAATTRMTIKGNGNVGIGTTSPGYKLDVNGEGRITGMTFTASGATRAISTHSSAGQLQLNGGTSATTGAYINIAGDSYSTGDYVEIVAGRTYFAGNIGIGTASPSEKLHVSGNIKSNHVYAETYRSSRTDGDVYIQAASSSDFVSIGTEGGNNNLLTVLGSGNVGVGTASPTEKLHVSGDVRIEGDLTVNGSYTQIDTDVNTTEQWNVTNDGTGPAVTINQTGAQDIMDVQDDGTSVFYIEDGGNVGIGTTNPSKKLEVNGSYKLGTNAYIQYDATYPYTINIQNTASAGDIKLQSANGENKILLQPSTGGIDFYTNNSERMRITDGGNVGIGTTSPLTKLDVNGATRIGGKTTYTKAYASLSTTGNAVAGLGTSGNGASARLVFEIHGGAGEYQRVVYSCYNASGNWYPKKVIDEGTNAFDVTDSGNATTVTFTFKARTASQAYTPYVTIEHVGAAIDTQYL